MIECSPGYTEKEKDRINQMEFEQEFDQALQEHLFYYVLKRMFWLEERRITALMNDVTSSLPMCSLTMKIGDLIDMFKGNTAPEDMENIETWIDLLAWVRQMVPDKEASEDEEFENEDIDDVVNLVRTPVESVSPVTKKSRISAPLWNEEA